MQTQLPFFPEKTKLINNYVGFRKQDDKVYYMHNGNTIYCHDADNRDAYRFMMGNLVVTNLCRICEICQAMGERRKNIERYTKALREHGAAYFFARKEQRGHCHKMTAKKLLAVQNELDQGLSAYRIALNQDVSESAIAYHIKKGSLKKKTFQRQ